MRGATLLAPKLTVFGRARYVNIDSGHNAGHRLPGCHRINPANLGAPMPFWGLGIRFGTISDPGRAPCLKHRPGAEFTVMVVLMLPAWVDADQQK